MDKNILIRILFFQQCRTDTALIATCLEKMDNTISLNGRGNNHAMKLDRKAPLTACFQCLNCYKTYKAKGPSKEEQDQAEQKALDCCGSFIQGFYVNYRRWGVQKWYGR